MSYLDTKPIYSIAYRKVPIETVANTERIELHLPGSILTINDEKEVHKILAWMKEAKRKDWDVNEYVRFMICEGN